MKKISLYLPDDSAESIREHYVVELSNQSSRQVAELKENEQAAREKVARRFERDGYSRQAEQMRNGELDVSEYLDVDTLDTDDLAEMAGAILAEQVDGLKLDT